MRIEAQRLLQQLRHAWWLWQACQPSELPERFKILVARFIELRAFPSFLIILWCFLSLCLALHNVSTTPNFLCCSQIQPNVCSRAVLLSILLLPCGQR